LQTRVKTPVTSIYNKAVVVIADYKEAFEGRIICRVLAVPGGQDFPAVSVVISNKSRKTSPYLLSLKTIRPRYQFHPETYNNIACHVLSGAFRNKCWQHTSHHLMIKFSS
jgi:hypothetical protein